MSLVEMVGKSFGRFVLQWSKLWIFAEVVFHCNDILVAIWMQCKSNHDDNSYLVSHLVWDMHGMYCKVGLLMWAYFALWHLSHVFHAIGYILCELGPVVPFSGPFPFLFLP